MVAPFKINRTSLILVSFGILFHFLFFSLKLVSVLLDILDCFSEHWLLVYGSTCTSICRARYEIYKYGIILYYANEYEMLYISMLLFSGFPSENWGNKFLLLHKNVYTADVI